MRRADPLHVLIVKFKPGGKRIAISPWVIRNHCGLCVRGGGEKKPTTPEWDGNLPLGYLWAVITSRATGIKQQPQDEALSYKDSAFLIWKPQESAPLLHRAAFRHIFISIRYHGNELEISQPHSFFSALPVSQYNELCKLLRQTTLLLVVFCSLAIISLLISWWPQPFGNTHPEGRSTALPSEIRVIRVCRDKSSWCNFYECLWMLGFEPTSAGRCGWILTVRWYTALALSEIYGEGCSWCKEFITVKGRRENRLCPF